MIRLRIALGVASSLVAVAALSIVFAGVGEAQGNGNGPNPQNVNVVNTPLPVTGNVAATVSGNVSATVVNPSNNPVLIRDVDRQGAKELWQANKAVLIADGSGDGSIEFDPVPAGKALIIEHINVLYFDPTAPTNLAIESTSSFDPSSQLPVDLQFLFFQKQGSQFVADAATKFMVGPGVAFRVRATRDITSGVVTVLALATGHLIDYP
jgi:hypothetical protein